MRRPRSSEIVEGKRHEVFKPRLQSRRWSRRLPAGLVQQASLLFKAMSRRLRGLCTKVTTRADNLFRMAFFATDQESTVEESTVEPEASSRPYKGTLRETEHSSNCLRQIPRSVRPPSPDRCMANPPERCPNVVRAGGTKYRRLNGNLLSRTLLPEARKLRFSRRNLVVI